MSYSKLLVEVVSRLSSAADLQSVTRVVAEAAREIAGADGATFVLRDEGQCYYVDESAISPLWKGRRFPADSCVSGWAMIHREVVVIRDIYEDTRVPRDAYLPTFVKSLCMVPIRSDSPMGAIGAYWARETQPSDEQVKFLQMLANCSATALENLELKRALSRRVAERDGLNQQRRELELQLHSQAHDLKSPLATMLGFTELLQMRARQALDEKGNQYVTSILQTGRALSRQIDKMLALYRLSHQTVRKQPIDLAPLAEEIVQGLRAQDPEREVELEVAPGLRAQADPELARIVLENLISNAFKFSRRKPSTWLRVGRSEDGFFVEDRGAGFAPADADRLFQPLVRLHDQMEFPGTGLGLASIARIIELHGGRVRAEGRPGEGATFHFSLPDA